MDPPFSDPSLIDTLLRDLHIISDNRSIKRMESMDMDLALEIPDTPERLTVSKVNEDSDRNPRRGVSFLSPRTEEERPFRKGRLASSISIPYDAKISHPTRNRSARRRIPDKVQGGEDLGKGTTSIILKETNHGKGVSLLNDESSSSSVIRGSLDKGKGVCTRNDPSNQDKKVPGLDVQPRNFSQRRLVRNGLISPVNIAKISNISEDKKEQVRGFSPIRESLLPYNQTGAVNLISQPCDHRPGYMSADGRGLHGTDTPTLTISSSLPRDKDVVNHSVLPRGVHRGKRKTGGTSSAAFYNQPASSSSVLPQFQGRTVIDVDELPSPMPRNSLDSDSDARSQQLISDEILAHQLQEQFRNESLLFGAALEEVDASVAWSLQQVENGRHSSARDRMRSGNSSSVSHLNRQLSRRPYNSRRSPLNLPRPIPPSRMAQMRRNLRRAMDLETRLDFLEALEVAFSMDSDYGSNFLDLRRDFDANDYEMLLALDDLNNRPSGASRQQINSLPESVIQTDSSEEPCAICLDAPSVGDTIRHLPCLHKFHKNCIDEWLRRKTTCPICKSEIV